MADMAKTLQVAAEITEHAKSHDLTSHSITCSDHSDGYVSIQESSFAGTQAWAIFLTSAYEYHEAPAKNYTTGDTEMYGFARVHTRIQGVSVEVYHNEKL